MRETTSDLSFGGGWADFLELRPGDAVPSSAIGPRFATSNCANVREAICFGPLRLNRRQNQRTKKPPH
jgi:hypothetical protein